MDLSTGRGALYIQKVVRNAREFKVTTEGGGGGGGGGLVLPFPLNPGRKKKQERNENLLLLPHIAISLSPPQPLKICRASGHTVQVFGPT